MQNKINDFVVFLCFKIDDFAIKSYKKILKIIFTLSRFERLPCLLLVYKLFIRGENMLKKDNFSFGNVKLRGSALDNCDVTALTLENIYDIKTILVYEYEDSKHCHDASCVMEIIFHSFQENIQDDRIRIWYYYPSDLLVQFNEIMFRDLTDPNSFSAYFNPSNPISVKMDLPCTFWSNDDESGIKTEDFDEFNCKIKHKKRFYETNPIMPDD